MISSKGLVPYTDEERTSYPQCISLTIYQKLMPLVNDKEMAAINMNQPFEDDVETDLLRHFNDLAGAPSGSDDLAYLFDLASSNDNDLVSSPARLNRDVTDVWHKAVEEGEKSPTSPTTDGFSSTYPNLKIRSSRNHSENLPLEDFFTSEYNQLRSTSQPSTPRPQARQTIKKAISFSDRNTCQGIQKLNRKSSAPLLSKMMQSPCPRQHIPDLWTRNMQTAVNVFQLQTVQDETHSPPPSSMIAPKKSSTSFSAQDDQGYMTSRSPLDSDEPHTPGIAFSGYQLTPQASPVVVDPGFSYSDSMGVSYSSSVTDPTLSALQTPPSSLRLPMTTWGPDTSPSLGYDFSVSPNFAAKQAVKWWNDDLSMSAQPQVGRCQYRESDTGSKCKSVGVRGADVSGLGISCDDDATNFCDFDGAGLGFSVSISEGMPVGVSASFDMDQYSVLYHTPPQQQQQQQPKKQERQQEQQEQGPVSIGHCPLSRSPSPTPQPRFHRRRASNHLHHSSRASHSSQSSRRKSSNTSQYPSTQQPKTSTGGEVGFVNFTPDDSQKILTGVAPSGSSKTKARREKEAAEKRRRLSQMAMKAIMEAGGDLDGLRRLEREGLFVLES